MSYDLYLVRVPAGKHPLEEARAIVEQDNGSLGPPYPEKEARKYELAKQLQLINPSLEIFQFDYGEIARLQSISEEERLGSSRARTVAGDRKWQS